MTLGEKLQKLRKARSLTQEELAEKVGVSRQSLSKWESDGALPDTANIILLADLFGVTTDYLLRDGEEVASADLPHPENAAPPADPPAIHVEAPVVQLTPLQCGVQGGFHADAGQAVVPGDFQMHFFSAVTCVIAHVVHQHQGSAGFQNPADETLIGLLKMGGIFVIDAELCQHEVRLVFQQILLHPGRAELGGGAADAGIDKGDFG